MSKVDKQKKEITRIESFILKLISWLEFFPALHKIAIFFYNSRFVHFVIVGCLGVSIHLAITAMLAEFVFSREKYFIGYCIGLVIALTINFIFHTHFTYKMQKNHKRRYGFFMAYSICMATLQAFTVKSVVPIVGVDYYLLVIPCVILIYSVISHLFFKWVIFKADFL